MLQPAFGWVSDRWPTRWFMWVGIAWTGILMGCVGLPRITWLSCWSSSSREWDRGVPSDRVHGRGARLGASARPRHVVLLCGRKCRICVGPVMAAWLMARFGLAGTVAVMAPGCSWPRQCTCGARLLWRGRWPVAPTGLARSADPLGATDHAVRVITLRSWGIPGSLPSSRCSCTSRVCRCRWRVGRCSCFCFSGYGRSAGWASLGPNQPPSRHRSVAADVSGPHGAVALRAGAAAMVLSSRRRCHAPRLVSVTVVFAQELLPRRLGLASGLTLGLAFGAGGVGVALSGWLADALGLRTSVWILLGLPESQGFWH